MNMQKKKRKNFDPKCALTQLKCKVAALMLDDDENYSCCRSSGTGSVKSVILNVIMENKQTSLRYTSCASCKNKFKITLSITSIQIKGMENKIRLVGYAEIS